MQGTEFLSNTIEQLKQASGAAPIADEQSSELINALIRELPDGVFVLRGGEILCANPIGERILAITGSPSGRESVLESVEKALPVRISLVTSERSFHYVLQAHALGLAFADRIVIAQDVTLAHESQQARNSFIGTLAHEVKTPMTSITMAIRLLHRGLDQMSVPSHRSLIQTCVNELDRFRSLMDDLIAVSRLDSLSSTVERQKVDLSKLIRHSVQNFRLNASERDVELDSSQSESLKGRLILLDPTKITWVISSLLKFVLLETPRGGRVELRLEPSGSVDGAIVSPNGSYDWIIFRMKSNGPDFQSVSESGVFDKYHPAYDIRAARSGNPKFGLAIAREILAAHGGQLWIEHSEICLSLPNL